MGVRGVVGLLGVATYIIDVRSIGYLLVCFGVASACLMANKGGTLVLFAVNECREM